MFVRKYEEEHLNAAVSDGRGGVQTFQSIAAQQAGVCCNVHVVQACARGSTYLIAGAD